MRGTVKPWAFRIAVALSVGLGAVELVNAQSLTWLGTLPESHWIWAYGVSADGSVVVGRTEHDLGYESAFRWENGVMQPLGTLGGYRSAAYGVSADGSVEVGWSWNASGDGRAFRWTASGGMQDMGTLGGSGSYASGVSADGSVVVGGAQNASSDWRAFRWTQATGMEDLNLTYAALLTSGSRLTEARAISPDGRYIVGYGYNAARYRSEAFLLDTWRTGDTNGDGCIDDSDLLVVLFNLGCFGCQGDVNNDGTVDDADLLIVLFNFGSGC